MACLKLHDQGVEVRKIQLLLNSLLSPSPNLEIDGDFGAQTEKAVKRFQECNGLEVDGKVGPDTLAALGLKGNAASTTAAAPPNAPWMDVAVAELGVHEDSLPGRQNERIVEYHQTTTLKATDDETPWCSSFVNWVMKQSGVKGTNCAAARSWLEWGVEAIPPSTGAITVIKRKECGSDHATGSSSGFHVAFFVSKSQSHIRLLGGNQSDQVKYSEFPLNKYEVKGYRVPA